MGSTVSRALRRRPPREARKAAGTTAAASHCDCNGGKRQDLSLPQTTSASPLLPLAVHAGVDATTASPLFHHSEMEVEPCHHPSPMAPDIQALELPVQDDGSLGPVLPIAAPPPLPRAQANIENGRPPVPPANVVFSPPLPPPSKPAQTEIACVICCDKFTKDQDQTSVIYPCKCEAAYCTSCVKDMFVKACKDTSRMPPRCCYQIQLHWARPYLTEEEAAEFREKYEEWSTPNPFYCPVPTCSVFISNRVLKQERGQRTDSAMGMPTSPNMFCPRCDTDICTNCRQLAHTDGICTQLTFGVDEETAALLKQWGYKRCPKCGQGVRRMYGCNHMECLCGAHWCWVCQKTRDECDGECVDSEDEDYDSEDEDENEEGLNNSQSEESHAPDAAPTVNAIERTSTQAENPQQHSPQPTQARNLDAGSRAHWETSGFDFGEEPTDDVQDRAWDCVHDFETAKIDFADSLRKIPTATAEMECSRCWSVIHPEIKMPPKINTSTSGTVVRSTGRGRVRGRVCGRGGVAPRQIPRRDRGLVRHDVTIGTGAAIHSASSFSQSLPDLDSMENVVFSNNGNRVVDTYGNIITTTDFVLNPEPPRRFSFDFTAEPMLDLSKGIAVETKHTRRHLPEYKAEGDDRSKLDASPFSLAYECNYCQALVCESCRKEMAIEAEARAETRVYY